MDIDIDENILDNSVLDLLFNQDTPKILTRDEIIDELDSPNHKMMTSEEMDSYIKDFLEENKGENHLYLNRKKVYLLSEIKLLITPHRSKPSVMKSTYVSSNFSCIFLQNI